MANLFIKNKIYLKIIGITFLATFFLVLGLNNNNNVNLKIEEIKLGFQGKIIEIYAIKNTRPTHLKVLLINGQKIDIAPNQLLVKAANVGDGLIKPKNENIVYLIKGERKLKFFYTKISYKTRKNSNFPADWKDKWPESSEWDKLNKNEE